MAKSWVESLADRRWGQYLIGIEQRFLDRAIDGSRGDALDVGCENGRWVRYLVDRGWNVTCTEILPWCIKTVRERIPEAEPILVERDDTRFPVADTSVDLLVLFEVGTITAASWFPEEAVRVLRPGGKLVATFHNSASLRGWAHRTAGRFDPARREGFYEGPAYSRIQHRLEDAGLRVLRREGFAWPPFNRESDSRLIPLFTRTERLIGLRRLPRFSPWVIVLAERDPGASGRC